jgi:hypothetical protein
MTNLPIIGPAGPFLLTIVSVILNRGKKMAAFYLTFPAASGAQISRLRSMIANFKKRGRLA